MDRLVRATYTIDLISSQTNQEEIECNKATLVTQPMMQHQPNPTELRSMDSYAQILCRFQKSIQKAPPPSLPCTKKCPLPP